MGQIARLVGLSAGLFGGIVFSQAPEFAQQYRQRIGGAIDELQTIVETFDRQAKDNKLDRHQALDTYATSTQTFLRNQGSSMKTTIDRYDQLTTQKQELSEAMPLLKPIVLARAADPMVFSSTWKEFVPAVPVSIPGFIWAAIGFTIGWIGLAIAAFLSRSCYRLGGGLRHAIRSSR